MARMSIEITDSEQDKLRRYIPWGVQSRIMRILAMQMVTLVERHGDIVLGALLSGKLTALDLLKQGGFDGIVGPEEGNVRDDGSGTTGSPDRDKTE